MKVDTAKIRVGDTMYCRRGSSVRHGPCQRRTPSGQLVMDSQYWVRAPLGTEATRASEALRFSPEGYQLGNRAASSTWPRASSGWQLITEEEWVAQKAANVRANRRSEQEQLLYMLLDELKTVVGGYRHHALTSEAKRTARKRVVELSTLVRALEVVDA